MLDHVSYRKARLRDAGALVRLLGELAGPAEDEAVVRRYRRMVLRPSYRMFLGLHEGRPIVFAAFRRGHFFGADAPNLQFVGLVVDPDFRRRGVAQQSIADAMGRFVGSGYSQMWVVTQQDHLVPMYQALGFEISGTRLMMPMPRGDRPEPSWRRLRRSLVRRLGL